MPSTDFMERVQKEAEVLVQEMAHIANGRDPGNSVSLLRVNVSF